MSELLLGVDLGGTSSSTGVLARPDGEVISTAERPHELLLPEPGWAEHDTEETWWKGFTEVCAELLEGANGDSVAAVCLSGIGPCFLAADGGGKPLRPAILYGIDTRASREVEELTERYGNEAEADWSSMVGTVEPNPENRGVYDELYSVYRDHYPATRPMVHTLAGIQTGGEF